jgi:thiol-disulfide isomerase/thioredoxin
MILTALIIYTNKDKDFQIALIDRFPVLGTVLNGFETNDFVTKELNKLRGTTNALLPLNDAVLNVNTPAPEFTGVNKWLNLSDTKTKLALKDLKGKVVLVDFWTYTCINCIRTLPHVTSWYETYKDKGFVVIGVHTPEFAFEKDTKNVESAIKQFKIHYPVAQDNDYATWSAYENQYWPAEYLIDAEGVVRRVHFGEGKYDKMEEAIQLLLKQSGKNVEDIKRTRMPDETPNAVLSPETYLGSRRMLYYQPNGKLAEGEYTLTSEKYVTENHFSLDGSWIIAPDHAIAGKGAALTYNFRANKVFLVIRPEGSIKEPKKIKVYLDGRIVDTKNAGKDVKSGIIMVDTDRLYELIDLRGNVGQHILRLEFEDEGIEVYAFTFG